MEGENGQQPLRQGIDAEDQLGAENGNGQAPASAAGSRVGEEKAILKSI